MQNYEFVMHLCIEYTYKTAIRFNNISVSFYINISDVNFPKQFKNINTSLWLLFLTTFLFRGSTLTHLSIYTYLSLIFDKFMYYIVI